MDGSTGSHAGSSARSRGRPAKAAPYASQIVEWLRQDPALSGAEILRRVRLAGYRGGKSALYQFVRRQRTPGFGYKRCPRCGVLMQDLAEFCPRCGSAAPAPLPPPPPPRAEARESTRQETQGAGDRQAPAAPAIERYLIIAAADKPELYEYFKRQFGHAATVEVVHDRRVAARRRPAGARSHDRRRRDRRVRAAAELWAFGFAIVIRDSSP